MLLPHLGFAYQELGQYDKAIATFEEARKLSPNDPAVAAYLIEANIAAKKYSAAADVAQAALAQNPDDLRLLRLQAQALRHERQGRPGARACSRMPCRRTATIRSLTSRWRRRTPTPSSGAQAVKVLQDAQAKFPAERPIAFELGAVFDKQKKFAEAEAAFRSGPRRAIRTMRQRSTTWATCLPSAANGSTNRSII